MLLLHGLSSIADSWWRMGPALAAEGWDVVAVDQAGHGGRPLDGPASDEVLVAAVRELVPSGLDAVIGHSLGALTTLALLEDDPGWARTVILEDPASVGDDSGIARDLARAIRNDHARLPAERAAMIARVRRDCPHWDEQDVFWAVEGIAQMRPEPFARWLEGTDGPALKFRVAERVLALDPTPYVLAARGDRVFMDGGSALVDPDRARLERELPAGHLITIDGGHCLHRDAPQDWLAAVRSILDA